MTKIDFEKEFKLKYSKYYPLISVASILAFSLPSIGLPLNLVTIAIEIATIINRKKLLLAEKKAKDNFETIKNIQETDKVYGNIFNEFNEVFSKKSPRKIRRFLEEYEAAKMDTEDLFGELIRLNKGKSKKAIVFVTGFNSEPEKLYNRSKYFNYFNDIINDQSLFIYVWDTTDSWSKWKISKRNTITAAKNLYKYIEYELPDFDEIVIIGHSLGCQVIYKTLTYRNLLTKNIPNVYLLGGAVSQKSDFNNFERYRTTIKSCYSNNDNILKIFYKIAEGFDKPIGLYGFYDSNEQRINCDCSDFVKGHSKYFKNLKNIIK